MSVTAAYEVVGFEGEPIVPFGRTLPVVRDPVRQRYAKPRRVTDAAGRRTTDLVFDFDERYLEELVRGGRVSRLPSPLPYPPDGLVVWADADLLSLLSRLGRRTAPDPGMPALEWLTLPPEAGRGTFRVAAASERDAAALLDGFAGDLLAEGEYMLREAVRDGDRHRAGEAERLVRAALVATEFPPLRSRLWLRFGAAAWATHTFERVSATYQLVITHEFPAWKWEVYAREVQRYVEAMQVRDPVGGRPAPLDPHATGGPHPASVDVIVERARAFVAGTSSAAGNEADYAARYARAWELAHQCAEYHVPEPDLRATILGELRVRTSSSVPLDERSVRVLGADPVLYMAAAAIAGARAPYTVGVTALVRAAREVMRRGLHAGPITDALLAPAADGGPTPGPAARPQSA